MRWPGVLAVGALVSLVGWGVFIPYHANRPGLPILPWLAVGVMMFAMIVGPMLVVLGIALGLTAASSRRKSN